MLWAIAALTGPQNFVENMVSVFRQRRDVLVNGLRDIGFEVRAPLGTFYVWASVIGGGDGEALAARLAREFGILVVPGIVFGKEGRSHVRFALTASEEKIAEATRRTKDGFGR